MVIVSYVGHRTALLSSPVWSLLRVNLVLQLAALKMHTTTEVVLFCFFCRQYSDSHLLIPFALLTDVGLWSSTAPAVWIYDELCYVSQFTLSVWWLLSLPASTGSNTCCCLFLLHSYLFCLMIVISLAAAEMLLACLNVKYIAIIKKSLLFDSAITSAARKLKAHLCESCDASGWRPPLLASSSLQQEPPGASAAGCLIWCWMLCDADNMFCNLHRWRRMSLDSLLSPKLLSAIGNWMYYSRFLWESFYN